MIYQENLQILIKTGYIQHSQISQILFNAFAVFLKLYQQHTTSSTLGCILLDLVLYFDHFFFNLKLLLDFSYRSYRKELFAYFKIGQRQILRNNIQVLLLFVCFTPELCNRKLFLLTTDFNLQLVEMHMFFYLNLILFL